MAIVLFAGEPGDSFGDAVTFGEGAVPAGVEGELGQDGEAVGYQGHHVVGSFVRPGSPVIWRRDSGVGLRGGC